MEKLKDGAKTLGISLSAAQLDAFETYYRELVEWNKKTNLTAVTAYEEVQVKHFLDSLTVVLAFDFNDSVSVIDVGTGAGFPGLPLKIAFPGIRLTLLEATGKKTTFLETVTDKLGLSGIETVTGRAEELAHAEKYREQYDVILSRAVTALPALAELCLPFIVVGGIFIAHKKAAIETELAQAANAIEVMGGEVKETVKVSSRIIEDERCLVVIKKVRPTPLQYPRRPGMPEKRPL